MSSTTGYITCPNWGCRASIEVTIEDDRSTGWHGIEDKPDRCPDCKTEIPDDIEAEADEFDGVDPDAAHDFDR